MAKSEAQLDREIAAFLGSAGKSRSRRHSTKTRGKSVPSDVEPGLRGIAQRSVNAENSFIEYAMKHGRLSKEQAQIALARFRKERVIKLDAVTGSFHVTHGAFLEPDVLRRAAGIEESVKRSHMSKRWEDAGFFRTPTSADDAKSQIRREKKNLKKAQASLDDAAKNQYSLGVKIAQDDISLREAAIAHFEGWLNRR